MNDPSHKRTDKEIEAVQKYIRRYYSKAQKELLKAFSAFAESVGKKAKVLLDDVLNAKTEAEEKAAKTAYIRFFKKLVKEDKNYRKALKRAQNELYSANIAASEAINKRIPKVYTDNYNTIGADLQKELVYYDFDDIEEYEAFMYGELDMQTVSEKKDNAWNSKNIAAAVITGAMLYLTPEKIANRTAKEVTHKNYNVAARQASDMLTDAENKGRIDSMYHASDEGFEVKKYWVATLDNRTRETHQEYDGMQPVELDYEYAPGLKRPRDPDCSDLSEVCNCRCRILYNTGNAMSATRAAREGTVTGSYKKDSSFVGTKSKLVENMSYREWMRWASR